MNKFDLHDYFFKSIKEAQEDENDPNQDVDPNVQSPELAQPTGQAPTQQSPNQTPQAPAPQEQILKQKTKADSSAFSNMIGSTISGIDFKQNGPNGGEISVMTSKSNRPLKISWAGNKVTVTQPDGNIVNLSERKK